MPQALTPATFRAAVVRADADARIAYMVDYGSSSEGCEDSFSNVDARCLCATRTRQRSPTAGRAGRQC